MAGRMSANKEKEDEKKAMNKDKNIEKELNLV